MPWHRWTPAFPNPIPAKEDASLGGNLSKATNSKGEPEHTTFGAWPLCHPYSLLLVGGT
jgi:hypothetical protein